MFLRLSSLCRVTSHAAIVVAKVFWFMIHFIRTQDNAFVSIVAVHRFVVLVTSVVLISSSACAFFGRCLTMKF